jgi:cation diffusion facilitator family transporter
MALAMLTVAARPADDEHPHGHGKAEYFSSGVEGTLILTAGASIAIAAVMRLLHPQPLESLGVGLAVSGAATLVNLWVARVLMQAARRHGSVTLEASSHHLIADVWTSVLVIGGVALVHATGLQWIDSAAALVVSAYVLWTGVRIVRQSVLGLMDSAMASSEREAVQAALAPHLAGGIQYHALRTRLSGARRFVSLHVLVPGEWTVHEGHELLERMEADIRRAVPNCSVLTHLESLEDPSSWDDITLDRAEAVRE